MVLHGGAGHSLWLAHTIAPARSLLSYYKSCLVALKPSPDDSTLWAWGSGQHCCSTAGRAAGALCRAAISAILAASAAAAAQVQPLARLVSQLDGRPQQADCNCPVQARWCAEMDAADYADYADYAGELVGAPRWMLLIALVNWLVRRRRCTTPCCRSWRVMMPASSILGPRTSRWRSPRVAKSL